VLIELPTWLGDCVMATPAIEIISTYFNNIEITIIGSLASTEVIKNHPKVINVIVLDKEYKSLLNIKNKLNVFDVYFSFRNSFRAKLLKILVEATNKYQFDNKKYQNRHQVQKYVDFVNMSLNINLPAGNLEIHSNNLKNKKTSKMLGINPGASYGSAKRWYPDQFAKIAIELSNKFDIFIFGGPDEKIFAKEIESILVKNNISNYHNLAGKTSISELISYISNLDIFITGDSGPMHIAASLKVPTISIFGPTNPDETSQWNNKNIIIKKNLGCQPCMKKSCPLKHHKCMKLIEAQDIIDSIPLIYELSG
jgi:heptosyltransferase II